MSQFNVETLSVGATGTLFVKDGASKDGTVFNVVVESIRDCHANPLKSKPANSRFLIAVKLLTNDEMEKPKFKSFYCSNIVNFVTGWTN